MARTPQLETEWIAEQRARLARDAAYFVIRRLEGASQRQLDTVRRESARLCYARAYARARRIDADPLHVCASVREGQLAARLTPAQIASQAAAAWWREFDAQDAYVHDLV